MWRILNKLFGWYYVWVRDCNDSHVCRVKEIPDGTLMGSIISRKFFITKDMEISGGYDIKDWKPLTWVKSDAAITT